MAPCYIKKHMQECPALCEGVPEASHDEERHFDGFRCEFQEL